MNSTLLCGLQLKDFKGVGRIAFLNPNVRERHLLRHSQPPLGLMSLMSACRLLEIPYGFIDADGYDSDEDQIISKLQSGGYKYLGVTLVSLLANKTLAFLVRIKEALDIKVVVGGPLPTVDTQWLMETYPHIDVAVLGEGEKVLPQVLLALEGKKELDGIAGVAYWRSDQLAINLPDKSWLSGDQVPMPDFNVINFKNYFGVHPVAAWPSAHLLVTRGCPFRCTFCSNPIWNHRANPIPVDTAVSWLLHLKQLGIRDVFFVDDTLNINREWFQQLCWSIIRAGLPGHMVFKAPFRANLADRDQLKLARKAGFWLIFYGVESGDQAVLDYYQKGEQVEDMAEAIELTRAAGLKSQASMIAGCPIDNAKTLLNTSNFLREADPDYAPIHPLIPYVGTKIADDIVKRGLMTIDEIRSYNHTKPSIKTESLDTAELLEIIDLMRKDFHEFKISRARRRRRLNELVKAGRDSDFANYQAGYEAKEALSWSSDGVPDILAYKPNDERLSQLCDELECSTYDMRFTMGEWYGVEVDGQNRFRWFGKQIQCPFFLTKKAQAVEFSCATLRSGLVRVSFFLNDMLIKVIRIFKPDWHTVQVRLPHVIQGVVWLKLVVHKPFIPSQTGRSDDNRKLGLAVRSIRFG